MAVGATEGDPIVGFPCHHPAKEGGRTFIELPHGSTKNEGGTGEMNLFPKAPQSGGSVQCGSGEFGGHVVG